MTGSHDPRLLHHHPATFAFLPCYNGVWGILQHSATLASVPALLVHSRLNKILSLLSVL
jgi:hypothetical protein